MGREGVEERVGEGRKGRKGRKGDGKRRGRKCPHLSDQVYAYEHAYRITHPDPRSRGG